MDAVERFLGLQESFNDYVSDVAKIVENWVSLNCSELSDSFSSDEVDRREIYLVIQSKCEFWLELVDISKNVPSIWPQWAQHLELSTTETHEKHNAYIIPFVRDYWFQDYSSSYPLSKHLLGCFYEKRQWDEEVVKNVWNLIDCRIVSRREKIDINDIYLADHPPHFTERKVTRILTDGKEEVYTIWDSNEVDAIKLDNLKHFSLAEKINRDIDWESLLYLNWENNNESEWEVRTFDLITLLATLKCMYTQAEFPYQISNNVSNRIQYTEPVLVITHLSEPVEEIETPILHSPVIEEIIIQEPDVEEVITQEPIQQVFNAKNVMDIDSESDDDEFMETYNIQEPTEVKELTDVDLLEIQLEREQADFADNDNISAREEEDTSMGEHEVEEPDEEQEYQQPEPISVDSPVHDGMHDENDEPAMVDPIIGQEEPNAITDMIKDAMPAYLEAVKYVQSHVFSKKPQEDEEDTFKPSKWYVSTCRYIKGQIPFLYSHVLLPFNNHLRETTKTKRKKIDTIFRDLSDVKEKRDRDLYVELPEKKWMEVSTKEITPSYTRHISGLKKAREKIAFMNQLYSIKKKFDGNTDEEKKLFRNIQRYEELEKIDNDVARRELMEMNEQLMLIRTEQLEMKRFLVEIKEVSQQRNAEIELTKQKVKALKKEALDQSLEFVKAQIELKKAYEDRVVKAQQDQQQITDLKQTIIREKKGFNEKLESTHELYSGVLQENTARINEINTLGYRVFELEIQACMEETKRREAIQALELDYTRTLSQKLKEREDEINKKSFGEFEQLKEGYRKQFESTQTEHDKLVESLKKEASEQIQLSQEQKTELENRITGISNEMTELKTTYEDKIRKIDEDKKRIENENKQQLSIIETQRKEIEGITERSQKLTRHLDNIKKEFENQLSTLERINKEGVDRVQVLNEHVLELYNKIGELEQSIIEKNKRLEELNEAQNENNSLRNEINQISTEIATLDTLLDSFKLMSLNRKGFVNGVTKMLNFDTKNGNDSNLKKYAELVNNVTDEVRDNNTQLLFRVPVSNGVVNQITIPVVPNNYAEGDNAEEDTLESKNESVLSKRIQVVQETIKMWKLTEKTITEHKADLIEREEAEEEQGRVAVGYHQTTHDPNEISTGYIANVIKSRHDLDSYALLRDVTDKESDNIDHVMDMMMIYKPQDADTQKVEEIKKGIVRVREILKNVKGINVFAKAFLYANNMGTTSWFLAMASRGEITPNNMFSLWTNEKSAYDACKQVEQVFSNRVITFGSLHNMIYNAKKKTSTVQGSDMVDDEEPLVLSTTKTDLKPAVKQPTEKKRKHEELEGGETDVPTHKFIFFKDALSNGTIGGLYNNVVGSLDPYSEVRRVWKRTKFNARFRRSMVGERGPTVSMPIIDLIIQPIYSRIFEETFQWLGTVFVGITELEWLSFIEKGSTESEMIASMLLDLLIFHQTLIRNVDNSTERMALDHMNKYYVPRYNHLNELAKRIHKEGTITILDTNTPLQTISYFQAEYEKTRLKDKQERRMEKSSSKKTKKKDTEKSSTEDDHIYRPRRVTAKQKMYMHRAGIKLT